ncbi:MAG: hypothetical protein D6679_14275 [Candidatus Hydrogenedentota bacterium]|nr:MAG: hypothetical protein D6679_14275 [Candidatus Hydrogenedentota bacterium]
MTFSPRSFARRFHGGIILFLLLLLSAAVRMIGIDTPFLRPHEANNAIYSVAARNLLRYGVTGCRYSNFLGTPGAPPLPQDYYRNHFPTLSIFVAAAMRLGGIDDVAPRLVAILFSLFGVALIFLVTLRRFSLIPALAAGLGAGLAPGAVHYGRIANFEVVILPFGLLYLDLLFRPDSSNPRIASRRTALLLLLPVVATSIDPPGALFLAGAAVFHRNRREILPGFVGACAILAGFAFVYSSTDPGALHQILHSIQMRTGIGTAVLHSAVPTILFRHIPVFFTPLAVAIALFGAGILLSNPTLRSHRRFFGALFVWGFSYLLLFPQAALIHEYWVFYLLPAIAFGCAAFLTTPRPRALVAAVLAAFLVESHLVFHRFHDGPKGSYTEEFAIVSAIRSSPTRSPLYRSPFSPRTLHVRWYTDARVVERKSKGEN